MKLTTQDYVQMEEQFGAHNYHPLDVVIERGEGVWVWDVDGKKYMDCLSGYSALNQGYTHPRIIKALTDQAQQVSLTSRAFRNTQLPLLEKEICELLDFDMFLPMNTGAEAVETALKVARKWAYEVKGIEKNKAEIIAFDGNFHGRTISIISFSTELQYKDLFGPHTPGFSTLPYGDIEAVKAAINPNTTAVLIEPIQGESGINIPPAGFLKELRKVTEENNVLLLADEIQTGLGRTGKLMAYDHEDIKPDITIVGKALGGGVFPVSGILASKDILGIIIPGDHGSTFGGNPLGAAVARESLKVLVEENLVENSAKLGEYLLAELQKIENPLIKEIRGRGLFVGIELAKQAGGARKFCEALKEKSMLCKETHENVIRLAPPLVITKDEIDWAIERLKEVLESK